MRPTRFSIGALMAAIVLVAVGLAGMKNPTPLWASSLFTATVALLCTAVVGTIASRGHARLTWAGMAVFGWVYLGIAFLLGPETNGASPPPFLARAWADSMDDRDASTGAGSPESEPLGERLIGPPNAVTHLKNGNVRLWPPVFPRVDQLNRRRIAHSFGTLAFALLGGIAARVLAARTDEAGSPRPSTGRGPAGWTSRP